MWMGKSRPDIAHQLVEKLLAVAPASPEALAFQASLWLQEDKWSQARQTLDNMLSSHPKHPATLELQTLVRVYGPDKDKLARWLLLARSSSKIDTADLNRVRDAATLKSVNEQRSEIAQLGRELFPNGPPAMGGLALEYFKAMATNPRDAGPASAKLAQNYQSTGDSRFRLAQLDLQLTRAKSPNAVLLDIEKLARDPEINQQGLQPIWRRALDGLNNSASNLAWFKAFLQRYPSDPVVVARLAAMQSAVERAQRLARDPANLARVDADMALEQGNLGLAAEKLEAVLAKRPRDAQSIGNLGLVRLRQGRHDEAQDLFARVHTMTRQQRWKDLGITAQFWGLQRKVDQDILDNQLADALAHAQQALNLQPQNAEGYTTLAGIRILTGETDQAIALYQQALQLDSQLVSALRGLAVLYGKTGRTAQALKLLTLAMAQHPKLTPELALTQANVLQQQGESELQADRLSPALRSLESALLLDPDNAWLRYRLARLYQRLELPHAAATLMDEGVQRTPDAIDMRYARALVRSALDDDAGALDDLGAIPSEQRSAGMHELVQRASISLRLAQALRPEQRAFAPVLLELATAQAGQNPELLLSVANAWFRVGQPRRAVQAFERLREDPQRWTPDVALQYAGLLNRARADAALADAMASLLSHAGWSPQQEATLLVIYADLQERSIEQLQQKGDGPNAELLAQAPIPFLHNPEQHQRVRARLWMAARAYDAAVGILEPLVAKAPDDPGLRMDLGNALSQQGQCARADEHAQWLDRNIETGALDDRLALLRLWQRCQRMDAARAEVSSLLSSFPNDSSVLQHAARLERANGQYAQAVALFQRAQVIERDALATATNATAAGNLADSTTATPVLRFAYHMTMADPGLPNAKASVVSDTGPDEPLRLAWLAEVPSASAPQAQAQGASAAIEAEIESIESRRQSWWEMGYKRIEKNSTPGVSTLVGWELPLVVWRPVDYDGRMFVHADQVSIHAGRLSAVDNEQINFGQLPTLAPADYRLPASDQAARGLNLGVGYQGERLSWDAGVIGIGFPVTNLVGGISQSGQAGHFNYQWDLSRRPLTGSLLSYAGAVDPVSGETWGGVVATGVGGRIATNVGPYSVSASVNSAVLTGLNVLDNRRLQMRAAVDRDLFAGLGGTFNMGLALSYWHFDSDLSESTWGHGGYYSPQRYRSLSLPVEWTGRSGPMSWLLRGALSVANSSSDASDVFPVGKINPPEGQGRPQYSASVGSGEGFSLRGMLEYQQSKNTSLGIQLELDRSGSYAPTFVMLYWRHLLDPVRSARKDRPQPVSTYSGF